jgi:hypothetical protein
MSCRAAGCTLPGFTKANLVAVIGVVARSYGQTFFGFLPIEKVSGSADTNS